MPRPGRRWLPATPKFPNLRRSRGAGAASPAVPDPIPRGGSRGFWTPPEIIPIICVVLSPEIPFPRFFFSTRFSSEIPFSSGGFSSLECGAAPGAGAFPGGGRNSWEISQPGPGSPEALPESPNPTGNTPKTIGKSRSCPGVSIQEKQILSWISCPGKTQITSQLSGKSNPLPG